EVTRNSLEDSLLQLKCHFTWNLFKEGSISSHTEDRIRNQIEFLNTEFKATMYNLLAYIKHLEGENEAALECLKKAEDLLKSKQDEKAEIRSLVTLGNYAWVYYHMGNPSMAQAYVDEVTQVCKKFANPYSMECPELDCEEGWTRLKCGRNERAKMCFEKALEGKPDNPEFSSGLAIATYRLDEKPQKQFPVDALKQAMELDSENQYFKVLLALKLQKMKEAAEGERLIEDALVKAPGQTDILRNAAQFYKKKGNLDRAIELFLRALGSTANNSHVYYHLLSCYRTKVEQTHNTQAEASESKDRIELRKLTLDSMNKALERKPSPLNSYSDLTEFLEVEKCYRIAFGKESPHAEAQQLYERYRNLLECHRKSEELKALRFLKQFPISETSAEKAKVKHKAQ
uniref:Interferon-induced protein with tetratricopeptide repeats 3 n=2 Tax=Nannospalax galili TaxID=1026970 RepID=A0A8C6R149_NANGA